MISLGLFVRNANGEELWSDESDQTRRTYQVQHPIGPYNLQLQVVVVAG